MAGQPEPSAAMRQETGAGEPLGIIAGGGLLPIAVAERAEAAGRAVHIAAIDGAAEAAITRFPHDWIRWGEVGRLLGVLKEQNCRDIVIVGAVTRPDLSQAHFDFGAIRNLPLILSLMIGGDDAVLSNVVRFFEAKGHRVLGAHEVAPDLLAPTGDLGARSPSRRDRQDIAKGFSVVRALGALDVGQAAVVVRGHVLGVEAAEGTDALLQRCAGLRQWGRAQSKKRFGVLVKAPKPGQELRVDMPAIGPQTVTLAAEAGLAGVAVRAGQVLLAAREEVQRLADSRGLFVTGLEDDAP